MSELVLLGTGSADGWPNPFCGCASCLAASRLGEVRGQSAALLDGTVMLDCGPEAPRAAVRAGTSLVGVQVVLLTHSHPDHASPAPLLWRSWAGALRPLHVVGPRDAVEAYQPWLGPDDPVTLRPVVAGDELVVAGYQCRAVAGTHEVPTVLWDVTCPDGSTLLYATDTGPLSPDALEQVRGRELDLLVLEETFGDLTTHGTAHHDLVSFPAQLADLRRVGALTERTRVVATHLSHHNPPTDELAARLAASGAEALPDGTRLTLGGGTAAAHPDRPRRTLVLGGARSGKSTHAEQLLADRDDVVYVATAGVRDGDADWDARVALHRRRRPEGWRTVESTDLVTLLEQDGPPLLVDCLALWCTDALDQAGAWEPERWQDGGAERVYRERAADLLRAWRSTPRQVVAVSNEVGSGVVPATWSGRVFRDELGRRNAAVASASDRVELGVAGTVQRLR